MKSTETQAPTLMQTVWSEASFIKSYVILDTKWLTKQALYKELKANLRQLSPEKALRILDFGGGLGTFASLCADLFEQGQILEWVVCDLSTQMMSQGMSSIPRNHPIYFTQANLLDAWSFPDQHFDMIISSNVFYLFSDNTHRQIIPELLRCLRHGGYIMSCNPVPDADTFKIVGNEIKLRRAQRRFALFSVLQEIIAHYPFLRAQRQLAQYANQKSANDWMNFYHELSEGKLQTYQSFASEAYAGQAEIWIMRYGT